MIFNSGYKKKPYLSRCLESTLVFTGIGIIFHAFLLEKSTQVVCVPCRSQSLEPKEYVKFYELTYTFSIGICYMCKYQFLSLLVVFRGFSAGYSFGNLVALWYWKLYKRPLSCSTSETPPCLHLSEEESLVLGAGGAHCIETILFHLGTVKAFLVAVAELYL